MTVWASPDLPASPPDGRSPSKRGSQAQSTRSAEEGEHVGLCTEFPSLSWLARTPQEALKGVYRVVEDVVADMRAQGEDIPEAIADRLFSGKFAVRIPPDPYRRLTLQARAQGVSLNRLVASKLCA
ncbi:toxin-antitoxin system HicB family antitoxin [Roseateles aquatilis]|uniref:Toxin-antitoxin system HicB family antitoxin n=1 Tax=Roseateles aquatilis TaxID=431061 RepID=A0A246JIX8_9BURK|nr:toxin-antitoxin system HicB family antitoxin [Roseateles aquatilis]OWQ92209.1 toxin-antitoxin system HicB family antitoxin [Roseateles aquatilis]